MVRKHAEEDVSLWVGNVHIRPNATCIQRVARDFRAQPIVDPHSLELVGLELLARNRLDYSDPAAMLRTDLLALEYASLLAREYQSRLRIHINVEISSMLNPHWHDTMAGVMCPGVVIELVERNELLVSAGQLHRASMIIHAVRRYGGLIALDDVSCTDVELTAIQVMRPDFVKLESPMLIELVRDRSDANIIIERIESEVQAAEAGVLGADELQGYWCDVRVEDLVPTALTPPGVMARGLALEKMTA